MSSKRYSLKISLFHEMETPEEGILVGYGAIIEAHDLPVSLPNQLALISLKKRQYENEKWKVFTSRHEPEDTLYKQLIFAIKYEGINLLVFKKLFEGIEKKEVEALVKTERLGQYSRKIWFLYEWLTGVILNIPDLDRGNMVPLVDEKLQYAIKGTRNKRHKIINNLPGTLYFCPLISKTEKLKSLIDKNLFEKKNKFLEEINKHVLQRASAFLLLKDSKASFTIEGEIPGNSRAMRWGRAIGQAGAKSLNRDELKRLQQIVIENSRFTEMGFRKRGGFVGEHDRITGEPIPDHISARWQDISQLIDGLLATNDILERDAFEPVLAAAVIAFGFVLIHPFEDGNGRVHRYLIHHLLARKKAVQQGIIFPVSASILNHIDDYRKVLEDYSQPLLNYIQWKETADHNVEVINNTIDYYRYYDATKQAEFLYECVEDTIENVIPQEVNYLQKYDIFKKYLDNTFEMPDNMVALLVRLLEQNGGKLSERAKKKEFNMLGAHEIEGIETHFSEIFIQK